MSSIIAVSWPMVRRVLLTICVAFAFAACGDPDDDPGNTGGTGAVPVVTAAPAAMAVPVA